MLRVKHVARKWEVRNAYKILRDRLSPNWECNTAAARHHPHRTHNPRSGSQDHHPSTNSVQKTICCNSASNAPDDGRMYPKHVELRIHQ